MNKISFALLLTVFIGFARVAFCMHIPLNQIEEKIFLREVDRVGIASISKQIAQARSPEYFEEEGRCGYKADPCLIIVSKFRSADIGVDPLVKLIFCAITENEQKRGCIPEQKVEHAHVTCINNKLGWYTKYWHENDDEGRYVKVQSTFKDKRELEKILDSLEEKEESCLIS